MPEGYRAATSSGVRLGPGNVVVITAASSHLLPPICPRVMKERLVGKARLVGAAPEKDHWPVGAAHDVHRPRGWRIFGEHLGPAVRGDIVDPRVVGGLFPYAEEPTEHHEAIGRGLERHVAQRAG